MAEAMPWRAALLLALALPGPARAGLWDRDAAALTRSRMPSALEILTGKFLRHTDEYYRWRVADREARLRERPGDAALADDLAVALGRLGEADRAIGVAQETLRANPERFETAATLGTLLIQAGRVEEGLAQLDRAAALQPDAPLGRERAERALAEYARESARTDGRLDRFAEFISSRLGRSESLEAAAERDSLVRGLLSVLCTAGHEDAAALQALGSLLAWADAGDDARRVAARAFLRASRRVADASVGMRLRGRAAEALGLAGRPLDTALAPLEAEMSAEQADADAWVARLHSDERNWLAEGRDPDLEFDARYAAQPLDDRPPLLMPPREPTWVGTLMGLGVALVSALVMAGVWVLGVRMRGR